MAVVRQLSACFDVATVARALADSSGVAVLRSADPSHSHGRWSYVGGPSDQESASLDPLDDDDGEGLGGTGIAAAAPRWMGVVPYEAVRRERAGWAPTDTRAAVAFSRPRWRRHRSVLAVDHREGRAFAVGMTLSDVAELVARLERGARGPATMPRVSLSEAEPAERHVERVVAAKELIVRGDLYQVNLARRLRIALAAPPTTSETLTLFEHLLGTAPTPFGACLVFSDGIAALSTTPELMLAASVLDGSTRFDRLLTIPIKGTRARGAFAASDAALRAELEADPKERAELTMIIDVERNDLGRVARIGSVRVLGSPMISTLRTVHHREAQIVARVRSDASRREVLEAMLPSGSVTGAPKVRAMEVIASLEPCRRGLYTGALGSVSHDGSLSLAMAIRTVVLHGAEGEYLTGGGIVADSDPLRELEETRWKAVQVARLVGA